jgi:hypothetical protein
MTTTASQSDQSGTLRCARHPNTETVLRCGRCDTPICAKCMVMSPVGARCPTCAQVKRFNLMLKPMELARAVVYGLVVAAVGTVIVAFISRFGLGLFAYAGLGYAVGYVVSLGANGKRLPALGPIAVACLFVGFYIGVAAQGVLAGLPLEFSLAAPILELLSVFGRGGLLGSPLIGLLLGSLLAWMRVR